MLPPVFPFAEWHWMRHFYELTVIGSHRTDGSRTGQILVYITRTMLIHTRIPRSPDVCRQSRGHVVVVVVHVLLRPWSLLPFSIFPSSFLYSSFLFFPFLFFFAMTRYLVRLFIINGLLLFVFGPNGEWQWPMAMAIGSSCRNIFFFFFRWWWWWLVLLGGRVIRMIGSDRICLLCIWFDSILLCI